MTVLARRITEECIVVGCKNRFSSLDRLCPDHKPVCALEGCNNKLSANITTPYCFKHVHLSEKRKDYCRTAEAKRKNVDRRLQKSFGITIEDKEFMILSQGGRCAICGTNEFNGRGPGVDHNHTTGDIRGILCHACNVTLGFIENGWDIEIPAFSRYLELYS